MKQQDIQQLIGKWKERLQEHERNVNRWRRKGHILFKRDAENRASEIRQAIEDLEALTKSPEVKSA